MSEPAKQAHTAPTAVHSGLILAAVAAICTTLVALTFNVTKGRIAANEQAFLELSLAPVLAGKSFDNDIHTSAITLPAPHVLPGKEAAVIYPLFEKGMPVAALFAVTADDGFSGPIRLLVGVDTDGEVTGVRVLEHRETPGLGDGIDETKSDWIHIFDGRSLDSPDREAWTIRRDGGAFDQLTGASVTSRAVVKAVGQTLLYFEVNRERIFETAVKKETGDD